MQEISRQKAILKNRIAPEIEEAVAAMAIEFPAYGQVRVSNELKKRGTFVSPGGVRGVWLRHDLESFPKRLKALEAKVAQEGLILTEAQVVALEKAKEEKTGSWRNRNRASRLFRFAGYFLRREYERRWSNLSANFH